jgi:hypothetical protein
MFRCLLHHLQTDHCVTCSKTVSFLQSCYEMYNISCFLIYNAVTIFKTLCISSSCVLKILKLSVKILNCSTLMSVGSCYSLRVLAIHVLALSSCVWVCNGVETLTGPCACCYFVLLYWCETNAMVCLKVL